MQLYILLLCSLVSLSWGDYKNDTVGEVPTCPIPCLRAPDLKIDGCVSSNSILKVKVLRRRKKDEHIYRIKCVVEKEIFKKADNFDMTKELVDLVDTSKCFNLQKGWYLIIAQQVKGKLTVGPCGYIKLIKDLQALGKETVEKKYYNFVVKRKIDKLCKK